MGAAEGGNVDADVVRTVGDGEQEDTGGAKRCPGERRGIVTLGLPPAADSEQDGDQPQQAGEALVGNELQAKCAQQTGGGQRADAKTVPGQDAPLAGFAVGLRTEQGQQKQVVDVGAGIAEDGGEDGLQQAGKLLSQEKIFFYSSTKAHSLSSGRADRTISTEF